MATTLAVKWIQQLSPLERGKFYTWIEGMTVADDREDGQSFSEWLHLHETRPDDKIWVFYDPSTDVLIGTASLVDEDRDLLAPIGGWVIGGVNVIRNLRGRGFGSAIMTWLESELKQRTRKKSNPVQVLLKADNPIAIHLYQTFGFTNIPGKVDVYGKVYHPGDGR